MSSSLSLKLAVSFFLLTAFLFSPVYSDCIAEQIHVALGDKFYWNQPSLLNLAPSDLPSIRIIFLTKPGCENAYISLEYTDAPGSTETKQAVLSNQTYQSANWNNVKFVYDDITENVDYHAIIHIFDLHLPPFENDVREVSYTVHTDDKAPDQGKYKLRIPASGKIIKHIVIALMIKIKIKE